MTFTKNIELKNQDKIVGCNANLITPRRRFISRPAFNRVIKILLHVNADNDIISFIGIMKHLLKYPIYSIFPVLFSIRLIAYLLNCT